MLKRTVGSAFAIVFAVVGVVVAAAEVPPEPRARRLDAMLVPEYLPCPHPAATPDIPELRSFPAPCASEQPLVVRGCSHPMLNGDECRFDPKKGKGRVIAKVSGNDVIIDADARGIVGCDGEELRFFVTFRLTSDMCSGDRCTVELEDWYAQNPKCVVTDGKCAIKAKRVNDILGYLVRIDSWESPNIEVLSAGFRHRGRTVFRAGIFIPAPVPRTGPTPTLDHPRQAKTAKVDLVTGHQRCLNPNTHTSDGELPLQACEPPELNDPVCRFGPNGRGWGRAQSIAGPDIRFEVDVQGIDTLDAAGRPPNDPMYVGCEGQRLCLTSSVRITSNDCVPGVIECTTEEVADAVIGKGHPDHPYAGCCIVSGGACHVETTLNALSDPADPLVKPGKLSIGGFLAGGLKRDASLCPGEPGYGDPPPDGPAFVPGLFLLP